jgi:hypothetical protein
LRAFGCKAYAITSDAQLKKNRLQRLALKAWIGYLLGYRSSNNYKIWLPTEDKIITIRNVIFDENELNNGNWETFRNELLTINTQALAK